jgi:cytochrome c oxidase subunit 3
MSRFAMESPSNPRAIIDVSPLPRAVMDHRSPIWWGNLLLLFIESTMFLLLFASYFYLKQNFDRWPPPRGSVIPAQYDTFPDLGLANFILVVLLVSIAPMLWASRACLHRKGKAVRIALMITVALGVMAIWLELYNTRSVHFRWDENAYASVVWVTLGLHILHVIVATSENALMTLWVLAKRLDDKHARDVRVTATYWYWVVGMWGAVYVIIYLCPRVI